MKCPDYYDVNSTKCKWLVVLCTLVILLDNELLQVAWGCPIPCNCQDNVVQCSGKNINSLSTNDLPAETQTLILDNNNFSKLPDLHQLQNLQVLSVSSNSITSLNVSDFSNLISLKQINLSNNKLTSVPKGAFSEENVIETLDVSHNELTNIDGLDVSFPQLKKLFLQNNKLENIDPIYSNVMPKLEILKAGYNQIQDLVKSYVSLTIIPFPNLKTMELNNNKIRTIRYYFLRFTKLRKIVLSHNNIKAISLHSFLSNHDIEELYIDHNNLTATTRLWLDRITKIDFSNNQIDFFEENTFKMMNNIEHMDMSNNHIHSIKTGMFAYLHKLTYLNLYGNQISDISQHAFDPIGMLSHLNLSRNEISIGKKEFDSAFKSMKALTTLDLSHNKILLIPSQSFHGLANLKLLDLTGNDIKYIEKDAFINLTLLRTLSIATNSLDCDCTIIWFRDWLTAQKDTLKSTSINGKCVSPAWLKNKDMMSVLKSGVLCVKHEVGHSIRPKVVVDPISTHSLLNGNVSMVCMATSSVEAPIMISWYRDTKLVENKKSKLSQQQSVRANLYKRSSTLVLDHIQYKDKGEYWCSVENIYGSDRSKAADMMVVVPPIISKKPQPRIVKHTGEDAYIPCSADGIPTPIIKFSKTTGHNAAWNYAAVERRIHYEKETFIIQNLKVEDSGLYTCHARSKAGEANATVKLIVVGKPTFIRPMRSKRVPVGTAAVLDCIISGNPRPTISWYKGDVLLQKSSSITLSDQMLIISSFQTQDEGSYSCFAKNEFGSASQSVRLEVSRTAQEPSNTSVAIIVMTVVVVFTVTSLIWLLLLCFCRRRRKRQQQANNKSSETAAAYFAQRFRDESIIPDLPKNYLLRCNGKLVSPPQQQQQQQAVVDSIENEHILSDSAPLLNGNMKQLKGEEGLITLPERKGSHNPTDFQIEEAMKFLKEQQYDNVQFARHKAAGNDYNDDLSDDCDDDLHDDQHDSGVLVHYKSGSSLGEHQQTSLPSCSIENRSGKQFVTIDLKNHHRDRRKDSLPISTKKPPKFTSHKHSSSIDSSTLCVNNNSSLEKSRRKRLASREEGQTYLTSSSGIESGVSSSAETISLNEDASPPHIEVI